MIGNNHSQICKVGGISPGLRVFISGAATGIGRVIADGLIECGARLHICDVSENDVKEFLVAHPGQKAAVADVADDAAIGSIFEEIERDWHGLDALVNNAGIAGPTGGVDEIRPDEWRRCVDVCLTGQFLCAHYAVPLIRSAGGGSIVNLSSAAGRFGYSYRTPYSSAKWGVVGFTQSLAKELGPDNIRVNAILPGLIEGPRIENVISSRAEQLGITHGEMKSEYVENISLRRMTPPEDIASLVAFLLSDMGTNLSGQSFGIDGNLEKI
ncbi:MAG: SDR family oxidoreductase [Albidovulum sp.]|nr:SDR family oxidoreductase [Albidovulum sp.]